MITPVERERRFLQTLWKNRLFDCGELFLSDGTAFEVVNVGSKNSSNIGLPDFSFAEIRFPDKAISFHGNIKIDSHSSHWREQGTINAPEYSSIILHIVRHRDMVLHQGDREIPTFVLNPPPSVEECYTNLQKGTVCAKYIGGLDTVLVHHTLTRMMSDRLDRKSSEVLSVFRSTGSDWHETAYICFLKAFGYREQKQSFETLARTLPLRYLRLHSDSLAQMEAMLLGQAGYLDVPTPDEYTRALQDEYAELRHRHNLNPRHISWRSTSVRPGSLPVQSLVRIAAILKEEDTFLDRIISTEDCNGFVMLFDVLLSEYWQTHFAPSRPAAMNSYGMTKQKNELLIINFAIPFLMAYGIYTKNDELRDRAVDLYENLPPENNRYIRHWANGGYSAQNAFFSQALIQLSTAYCEKGLCASCPFGVSQLSEAFQNSQQQFSPEEVDEESNP